MELHDILLAADVVENKFPPKTLEDVMSLVASLNLLNAAVKMPIGKGVTTYGYIKGHVGLLFVWLLVHPIEGVDIYHSRKENVTYFKVPGYQFSFHQVPFLSFYKSKFSQLKPQKWDGLQLQPIAVEVFQSISNQKEMLSKYSNDELINKMHSFSKNGIRSKLSEISDCDLLRTKKIPPQTPMHMNRNSKIQDTIKYPYKITRDKERSLYLALTFNGFNYMEYEHCRLNDPYCVVVVYYDGKNYERMMHLFYGQETNMMFPENKLEVGKHYYLDSNDKQLKALTFEQHCIFRIKYPNLIFYNRCFTLCISYNLAVYISKFFLDLRFVNLLNYDNRGTENLIYTPDLLEHEPQDSRARYEKVWIVIDEKFSLRKCKLCAIPRELIEEYYNMPVFSGTKS